MSNAKLLCIGATARLQSYEITSIYHQIQCRMHVHHTTQCSMHVNHTNIYSMPLQRHPASYCQQNDSNKNLTDKGRKMLIEVAVWLCVAHTRMSGSSMFLDYAKSSTPLPPVRGF